MLTGVKGFISSGKTNAGYTNMEDKRRRFVMLLPGDY